MSLKFKLVDVFTTQPFKGNPVAVVLDANALTTEQMQHVASWLNLSETTFVLSPTVEGADYRLRIFTPTTELPFAGHPTLGTAHALLEAKLLAPTDGEVVQECGVGLVRLKVEADGASTKLYFALPPAGFSALDSDDLDLVREILSTGDLSEGSAQFVDVGPVHTVVQLKTAEQVLALTPDMARLVEFSKKRGVVGIIAFAPHPAGSGSAIESRAFFPILGIQEDPVCGSGNGAIGAFIAKSRQKENFGNRYISSQGGAVGRDGFVHINIVEDDRVYVGGDCVTCVEGSIQL